MSTVKTKIEPEIVLAYIQNNFDSTVSSIEFIKGGEMSQAFSFHGKDGNFVIRINTSDRSFYKDDYAYKHFHSSMVPVPEMISIGKLDDKYFFAISKMVLGKHINDLTDEEYMATLPNLIEVLDAIHAVDISDTENYGKLDTHGKAFYKTWKESVLSVNNWPDEKNLFETSFLEKDVWTKVYKEIERLSQYCPEERYLVHGDYSHNNVRSDGMKVTGVYDWEGSMYGDFVYDVAWMTYWLKQPDRIEATEKYFVARNIPNFKERLLCYKLRIGLSTLSFSAFSEQKEKYDKSKKRIFDLLS